METSVVVKHHFTHWARFLSMMHFEPSALMRSEGYGSCLVCLSVCLSVCQSVSQSVSSLRYISLLEPSITPQTIPSIQSRIKVETYVGFSLKLLRSGITAWNTSNRLIRTGLPRAGPLALCILKAQEVTTKSVYRLLHAIFTAHFRLRETVSKRILIAQPIN